MTIRRSIFLCLIIFAVITVITRSSVHAQVVNIESERLKADSNGIYGSLGGNFELTSNTKRVVIFDAAAQLEYKQDSNLYLLLGNYGFVSGDKEAFANNAFVHLRYNRKITTLLRWEVFTQLQFNEVSKINLRYLLGTGPRFKLVDKEKLKIYAASLAMFEYEEDDTSENAYHRDVRSSSYLTFTFVPIQNLRIISTTYYQPLYNELSDFRLMNQESVEISISGRFKLEPAFNYLYDSKPVSGVPKVNYSFKMGLEYHFN
jgi:putative salt-induced outer membrane protein YdiY